MDDQLWTPSRNVADSYLWAASAKSTSGSPLPLYYTCVTSGNLVHACYFLLNHDLWINSRPRSEIKFMKSLYGNSKSYERFGKSNWLMYHERLQLCYSPCFKCTLLKTWLIMFKHIVDIKLCTISLQTLCVWLYTPEAGKSSHNVEENLERHVLAGDPRRHVGRHVCAANSGLYS